jgi:ascorbate-specific PTS system EIIC-type component UlaA
MMDLHAVIVHYTLSNHIPAHQIMSLSLMINIDWEVAKQMNYPAGTPVYDDDDVNTGDTGNAGAVANPAIGPPPVYPLPVVINP